MSVEEQFQTDIENNRLNPVFPDEYDDIFGEHKEGKYMLLSYNDNDEEVLRFIFDNGNVYELKQETGELSLWKRLPQSIFIHRHIQILIQNYYKVNNFSLSASGKVMCAANEVISRPFVRIIINRENCWVGITNFFLPLELRHNNYGKNFLKEIYALCQNFGFRLLLLDCVPTFYKRMVARGAVIIEEDDHLEITSATDLCSHY